MPNPVIQLDTPFNPGDLDPGKTYPFLIIHNFNAQFVRDRYVLSLDYLDAEGNIGKTKPKDVIIQDFPREEPPKTDYSDLRASLTIAAASGTVDLVVGQPVPEVEPIWYGAARVLYEYLIANYHPGTIVPV